MSDFFNYRYPKAAKDHRCEWCGEGIPKGETHAQGIGIWQSEWQNWRMHQECFDAMTYEDYYGDEGFTPFDHERPKKPLDTEIAL